VVLSREERARLLAGDHSAIKRSEEPEVSEGERVVLVWSRGRRVVVDRDTGEVADYPRRPLVWVELSKAVRHRTGGWRVGVSFHDERVTPRFLGRAAAPATGAGLTPETERGYRSSAVGAIDTLEALSDEELQPLGAKSRERWAEHLTQQRAEEEARRQERALRERLKNAVRGLDPVAAQALLASIERQISRALGDE
jgi:hypothetical protein